MKSLKQIILERKSKILSRQKFIVDQFEKSNQGKLKMSGVKKLAAQIENNTLRFAGFPTWVLESYVDPARHGAIPLKNNKWLDVQNIVNSSGEIDPAEITYGGFVVDNERNRESGVKTLNIVRSQDVDVKKYAKLLLFKRAVNQAKSVIAMKNMRQQLQGMPEEGAGLMPPMDGGQPGNDPFGAPADSTGAGDLGTPATETPAAGTTPATPTASGEETDKDRIDPETGLETPPEH